MLPGYPPQVRLAQLEAEVAHKRGLLAESEAEASATTTTTATTPTLTLARHY